MKHYPLLVQGRIETASAVLQGQTRPFSEVVDQQAFARARERLLPQFAAARAEIANLPAGACPAGFAVLCLDVSPDALEAWPMAATLPDLLRAAEMVPLGRMPVPPDANRSRPGTGVRVLAAVQPAALQSLIETMDRLAREPAAARQLCCLERVLVHRAHVLANGPGDWEQSLFEAILHLLPGCDPALVQHDFWAYAARCGCTVLLQQGFVVQNVWYVPVRLPSPGQHESGAPVARDALEQLAACPFVRALHPAPGARPLPQPHPAALALAVPCSLPRDMPLSSRVRAALLGGGLPARHPLGPWLAGPDSRETGAGSDVSLRHGLAITSAFLFGPIVTDCTARRPFALAEHHAVPGEGGPCAPGQALAGVEEALLLRGDELLSLGIGPDCVAAMDVVHGWTALLDDLLADGRTLLIVPAGNTGSGNCGTGSLLVPGDCANALCVGAASRTGRDWSRAFYSAVGSGRGGSVKPDVLAFGGSGTQSFHVLIEGEESRACACMGTELAAAFALRQAAGIRAALGDRVTALAIRALLVHGARKNHEEERERGFGKIPESVLDMITTPADSVLLLYQGCLRAGKVCRIFLPTPARGLQGACALKATLCSTAPVDPQDSFAYVRAGLQADFCPHGQPGAGGTFRAEPSWKPLFPDRADSANPSLLPLPSVCQAEHLFAAGELAAPVLAIRHVSCAQAGRQGSDLVPFALVLTLRAPEHAALRNDLLAAHPGLQPMDPDHALPVRF